MNDLLLQCAKHLSTIFPFEAAIDVRVRSSLKYLYRQLGDKRLDATKELKGSENAVLIIYILHFQTRCTAALRELPWQEGPLAGFPQNSIS